MGTVVLLEDFVLMLSRASGFNRSITQVCFSII